MVAGVASLLWSDPPRSQQNTDSRTVSGSSAPIGTNDAPPRLPASVPLTVPATPAGGSGVTGSSIGLLATDFVADQLLPDIDATSVMQPDGVQRPITMNAQPGVAPD